MHTYMPDRCDGSKAPDVAAWQHMFKHSIWFRIATSACSMCGKRSCSTGSIQAILYLWWLPLIGRVQTVPHRRHSWRHSNITGVCAPVQEPTLLETVRSKAAAVI